MLRLAFAAGVFAAAVTPASLHAQAVAAAPSAVPDSIAFARQFVEWVFSNRGDSAYTHAGARLRESMKSADGVNSMAGRIFGRFGAMEGTDTEVQFDEDALKVYIAVLRFPAAPEPGAFVVAYSPATMVVERASFGPLSNVKTKYPQAKLP
jgi:hypothetical protein